MKKLFSLLLKTKVKLPKRPYDGIISDFYYERVTRELLGSKYCEISDSEEVFIKYLLLKLHQNNQKGFIQLTRMSSKAIDVSYNRYPIGKIKLQGNKTWMQILISLNEQDNLENESIESYVDAIDLWVAYIKKLKLNN